MFPRTTYPPYWTVSLALEMVATQTDFNHACSTEEADTRMLLHVKEAMNCGCKSLMIRTVDTDVVVLDIAHFQGLPNIEQPWITFGTGKYVRYISIHEIASTLCHYTAK